jgi:hypothetical protein
MPQEYCPIMKAWAKVRGFFANPGRAERRRQRKIRSAMIGQSMARGDGGHRADSAIREDPTGGAG